MSCAVGRDRANCDRVADDVVLDHHLGIGGDEHVKAGFAGAQAELEGPARHARHELEQAGALARGLRQHLRVGADDDVLGANPVCRAGPRPSGLLGGGMAGARAARRLAGRGTGRADRSRARRAGRRLGGGQRGPSSAGARGSGCCLGARSGSSNRHRLGRSAPCGQAALRVRQRLAFVSPSRPPQPDDRSRAANGCDAYAWGLSRERVAR